mgnify:CR=1 FL=1
MVHSVVGTPRVPVGTAEIVEVRMQVRLFRHRRVDPGGFQPLRLPLRVHLPHADAAQVKELLEEAWTERMAGGLSILDDVEFEEADQS